VTNGVVDEVPAWINGPGTNLNRSAGGLSVRIQGDDGLRYYGGAPLCHRLRHRVGLWVPAGKVLGRVGTAAMPALPPPTCIYEISIPAEPLPR